MSVAIEIHEQIRLGLEGDEEASLSDQEIESPAHQVCGYRRGNKSSSACTGKRSDTFPFGVSEASIPSAMTSFKTRRADLSGRPMILSISPRSNSGSSVVPLDQVAVISVHDAHEIGEMRRRARMRSLAQGGRRCRQLCDDVRNRPGRLLQSGGFNSGDTFRAHLADLYAAEIRPNIAFPKGFRYFWPIAWPIFAPPARGLIGKWWAVVDLGCSSGLNAHKT